MATSTAKKATKKTTTRKSTTKAKPKAMSRATTARVAKGGKKRATTPTKATNATRAKQARPAAKPTKASKDAKPTKLSLLDAAAQVLAKHPGGLRSREMVELVTKQGLWTSPGGKTPHASLYAAIIREIAAKGKAARFIKKERGLFTIAGKGA